MGFIIKTVNLQCKFYPDIVRRQILTRKHPPLSRELILETALSIIDDMGVDLLSMRSLAKQLNIEAMSLYNHIRDKDDLLNGIVEIIVCEIQFPEQTTDWKTALRSVACAFYDVLTCHPNAIPILLTHSPVTQKGLEQVEKLLSVIKKANTAKVTAYSMMHILLSYVIGHASIRLFDMQNGSRDYKLPLPLNSVDFGKYPNIEESIQVLSREDIRKEFLYGLELFLNSL